MTSSQKLFNRRSRTHSSSSSRPVPSAGLTEELRQTLQHDYFRYARQFLFAIRIPEAKIVPFFHVTEA
jgi:hypothetical protein